MASKTKTSNASVFEACSRNVTITGISWYIQCNTVYVHHVPFMLCALLGVEVQPPGFESFHMKAYVVGCTCDLPAKAMVQNFIQFNGFYGCGYCEQEGSTMRTQAGGNVHVFLYETTSPSGPVRTTAKSKQYAEQAVEQQCLVIHLTILYIQSTSVI